MAAKKKAGKCSCRPGRLVIGFVIMALGLYSLVGGYLSQSAGVDPIWMTLVWYLVGLVILKLGLWAKHSGCADCKIHSK